MVLSGRGVAKDEKRAAELFERACNAGSQFGCRALGIITTDGSNGVTQDPEKAKSWFSRGCSLGDSVSCEKMRIDPRPARAPTPAPE